VKALEYLNPPIKDRVIQIQFDLSEAVFGEKSPEWIHRLNASGITIHDSRQVPFFFDNPTLKTESSITYGFKNIIKLRNPQPQKQGDIFYEIYIEPPAGGQPGEFKLSTRRISEGPVNPFNELLRIFSETLKYWGSRDDFKVKKLGVFYDNCLHINTQPDLWNGSKINWCLVAPFLNFEVIPECMRDDPAIIFKNPVPNGIFITELKLEKSKLPHPPHPHVEFRYKKFFDDGISLGTDLNEEIKQGHDLIISSFEAYFPPNAKKSFKLNDK